MEISSKAKLPTKFGDFFVQSFREILSESFGDSRESLGDSSDSRESCDSKDSRDSSDSPTVREHLVVMTEILGENPLVRIHSECLTGDVFGSCKCDCGDELAIAMRQIAKNGGMIIYLRQEGRGIGLFNKINAYSLQDGGLDTVEANEALGFKSDSRDYAIVGEILAHFGIQKIRLLTNNPRKIAEISRFVEVSRMSIIATPNAHNKNYLRVKKHKLGHLL